MLYTVKPLERIYAAPETFDHSKRLSAAQAKETSPQEYKDIMLQNGRIVTRRNGEEYVVERINSTDMKDYLNEEYVPGKSIKRK
ncbi:MAG: hypothetical protein K0R00_3321 [Herbinix sp.]|nr:hypothetical protein [Herbinix sp.]